MKGLLIKDFKLLMQQVKFLLIVCVFFVFMAVEDMSFVMGYVAMMVLIIVLGTISYDDFDNGYAFLFTLPISRKEYVAEKYGLCIGSSIVAGIITVTVIIAEAIFMQKGVVLTDILLVEAGILAVCILICAVMLPIMLKYGSERSKLVMFSVAGVIVLCGFLFSKLQEMMVIDISEVFALLVSAGAVGIVTALIAVCIVAIVGSFFISVKIMEKKEF